MPERVLAGKPAAPGAAAGTVRQLDRAWRGTAPAGGPAEEVDQSWRPGLSGLGAGRGAPSRKPAARVPPSRRPAVAARAAQALAAAGAELTILAERLRAEHRTEEAAIVETGALLAADPLLAGAVERAVLEDGMTAPEALLAGAEAQAAQLAALGDDLLAARAADVRSLGRRAAALASARVRGRLVPGEPAGATRSPHARLPAGTASGWEVPGADGAAPEVVLVARDLGPGDVAELPAEVRAVALAAGSPDSHAAIVARSIGLPMVVSLGPAVLRLRPGRRLLVDGTSGTVVVTPASRRLSAIPAGASVSAAQSVGDAGPALTSDGQRIQVLANVAGPSEVVTALRAGAEGVGLLRSELPFLHATRWPDTLEQRRRLRPILTALTGRVATVRLFDFGGDKTPPFLRGRPERGIQLLATAPMALKAQLQAILEESKTAPVRLLVPMVVDPEDVRLVRRAMAEVAATVSDTPPPQLGAMVEVPAAVTMARRLAREVDFFSIGTNDLSHLHLGRARGGQEPAPMHHPAVLQLIADTVQAAAEAGLPVAVCGEAAADPLVMPLLVGLGVHELSVGAARVATVRTWVRRLSHASAIAVAREALQADSAAEVATLAESLRLSLFAGLRGKG